MPQNSRKNVHVMHSKDTLFNQASDRLDAFTFDESVAKVFNDMIQRSVPGYPTIINMIGQLAKRYVQNSTRCYDLGCSLGAASLAMRHCINTQNNEIISVDNSAAMISRCHKAVNADSATIPVTLVCEDIQAVNISNASMCVLNFTLQFIPIADRLAILQNVAMGMVNKGVLILSEKIAFDNHQHNQLMIDLHHNFKKNNGYSSLEIAQKRAALENVLIPESASTHQQRLLDAGFSSVNLWFQCFNFASFIAFK